MFYENDLAISPEPTNLMNLKDISVCGKGDSGFYSMLLTAELNVQILTKLPGPPPKPLLFT